MVCIAAFIILCLVGVFVAFLSLFRRDIGKKYWKVFQKAWGCVWKKVRLQKCETNFKDDVKNSLLSKVVLKRPQWVKPLGAAIEVGSVLIVFVTIWSLVESAKAGLALWTFGTCNVSQPASCALGAEMCSIDAAEPKNPLEWTGRWFSEWGEIFANLPDSFRKWNAEDFLVEPYTFVGKYRDGQPLALDIFDPGCSVCLQSYRNQKNSGFFEQYNVVPMLYVITLPDGTPKFSHSDLIAQYFYAANLAETDYADQIIARIFTGRDQNSVNYQVVISTLSSEEAEKMLKAWLKDFGASEKEIAKLAELAKSNEVAEILAAVKDVVENRLHAKGIPLMVYDERKHSGLFEER